VTYHPPAARRTGRTLPPTPACHPPTRLPPRSNYTPTPTRATYVAAAAPYRPGFRTSAQPPTFRAPALSPDAPPPPPPPPPRPPPTPRRTSRPLPTPAAKNQTTTQKKQTTPQQHHQKKPTTRQPQPQTSHAMIPHLATPPTQPRAYPYGPPPPHTRGKERIP